MRARDAVRQQPVTVRPDEPFADVARIMNEHAVGSVLVADGLPIGLRASVRDEAVILAVMGTALGLVLALGAGIAVTLALGSQGISQVVVPAAQLMLIGTAGVLAGALAALLPARRAARVEILRAVG